MRIHAVLNEMAGTLIDADREVFVRSVKDALSSGAQETHVDLVAPSEIGDAMDRAIASGIDTLVVGGGDGTIKAAAAKLVGKQTALAIIPLGTINLLARDLKIPFDPIEAASVVASGERRTIDVASVNGDIFLCSSLLGVPIHMAEHRQRLRGKALKERVGVYITMLRAFLFNRRRFSVELDDGKAPRRVRALSMAISNNPLSKVPSTIPQRSQIDTGKLALYISKHKTGLGMAWAILKRLMGQWERSPDIEEIFTENIVLRSSRKRVRVSNDGEIVTLETPLHYRIDPLALNVIVPRR